MDDILKLFGIEDKTYDDLNDEEKKTYQEALDLQSKTALTPDQLKDYIENLLFTVARDLSEHVVVKGDEKSFIVDSHLKARLRNYLLFYMFLRTPEMAKKALDRMVNKKS